MVSYYKIFIILLLPFFSVAQNSDWKELQGKIDTAIKYGGTVRIERNYRIDKPLIAANWNGVRYTQVYFRMIGDGSMWDMGRTSVITATFNDAPVFSIQCGKGVLVQGVTFSGGKQGRDSRYSPQAAVCIDPFSGLLPPDSGYPSLREWYRGPQTSTGSTGLRFEDCTFKDALIGFITSPNGKTQNADILTLENIRVANVKYGIVGCQAQEKMNRIINIANWTKCNVMFLFNRYGAQQPGHWDIEGVSLAGNVDSLVYRYSLGWGPLFINKVFAEQLKTIGVWYAGSGDVLSRALINLQYPEHMGYFPDFTLSGRYLTIKESNIRYYGRAATPMLFYWAGAFQNNEQYLPPILNAYGYTPHKGFKVKQPFRYSTDTVSNHTATVYLNYGANVTPGAHILFMQMNDWSFKGQGQVASVSGDTVQLRYISPAIKDLSNYRIGVYEKN